MAQLQTAFDATRVDPSQGIGQLPIGAKLPVAITDSEVKATKDNSGGYIQLTLQVQQGENAGRKGAYRINLYNSSEAARGIAERQLSALCHVTGVFNLQDTQQLHNIPFLIDVVAQADPKYTEVKAVYDINGNEPGRAHQQNHQHQQSQPQQQAPVQQPQPQPEPQQTQQPAWGGGQPQQQQAPVQNGWGGQQQAPAPEQQQQTQQAAPGGWNQGGAGGAAPWGQK